MYEKVFTNNKVISVLWSSKRESGPTEQKECRLGIQLLPMLPYIKYVNRLVEWKLPAFKWNGVGED